MDSRVDTEILYTELFTPLFRFVFFRTKDYDVALDVTQTTFLKFLEQETMPNDSEHAKRLLYTIARTTLVDHWRSAQLRTHESLKSDDVFAGTLPTPEELAQQRQDTAFVQAVLTTLTDTEAEIIALRLSDEMSYDHIAALLDIREANARQIYSRALKKVEAVLRDSGQF